MGIDMKRKIDPAAECIRYLTQKYCVPDPPDSVVVQNCRDFARELPHPPGGAGGAHRPPPAAGSGAGPGAGGAPFPLGGDVLPGAEEENLLAWGLYMLARQGGPEALPPETLRRRLMAFLLTRELDELAEVRDLAGLTAFLNGQTCGIRTKWICLQIWQDPLVYWDRYCRMAALAEEVFAAHREALQPLADQALQWLSQRLEADSGLMWNELEMEQGTDEVVVAPLCLEFNALGIVWDETQPEAPACQFVGILRPQVQALRESCGSRAEQMAEQMKIVADKSRLEILMALRAAPLCGQELSRQVGLSAGTISHHMACLVREGFVAMSKRGSRVTYELRRGKLEELLDALRASLI